MLWINPESVSLSWVFFPLSVGVSSTMCDGAATTLVRVSPSSLPAVVVGSATAVAGHIVLLERTIADELPSLSQRSSAHLTVHHRLCIWVNAVPNKPIACPPATKIGTCKMCEAPVGLTEQRCCGLHHGRSQEEEKQQQQPNPRSHSTKK